MDLIGIIQALTEKSILVSVVVVVSGMYLFIKASVDILMTTNSRFDKLDASLLARSTETTATMKDEITRLHVHIGSVERFAMNLGFALMQVVPDSNFRDKVTQAVAKMQERNEIQ